MQGYPVFSWPFVQAVSDPGVTLRNLMIPDRTILNVPYANCVAGALSLAAYWVVIWAFTQAPIALVAALRETSVLFAMLFGIFLLKERATWPRWVAAALFVAGVILIRL